MPDMCLMPCACVSARYCFAQAWKMSRSSLYYIYRGSGRFQWLGSVSTKGTGVHFPPRFSNVLSFPPERGSLETSLTPHWSPTTTQLGWCNSCDRFCRTHSWKITDEDNEWNFAVKNKRNQKDLYRDFQIIARFRNYTRFRNCDSETTSRKLFRAIQKLRFKNHGPHVHTYIIPLQELPPPLPYTYIFTPADRKPCS